MVTYIIRAILGIADNVYGHFDEALVLRVLGTMIVCVLVYCHLFRRYPEHFFSLAVPLAILYGASNTLLNALVLAPNISDALSFLPLTVSIIFHALVAVATGIACRALRSKGDVV